MAVKPPADFAALDPADWDRSARTIAAGAERDLHRLLSGQGVGRDVRLRALAAALMVLYSLSRDEAWVAARTVGPSAELLATALDGVLSQLPDDVLAAAAGAAGGANLSLAEEALAVLVQRSGQAITADWVRLAASTQTHIVETLQTAIVSGAGPRDAASIMRTGVYEGVALSHARALTIARTEVADAYTAANLATYRGSGAPAWRWVATPGPRTCALCLSLHGTVFPIEEQPYPHHNCRCTQVPVFDLSRVGPDGRWPGTQVDNATIASRLPSNWTMPADPREMVVTVPTPGWRPYRALQRPG